MSKIDSILLSGNPYDIQDKEATKVVNVTQAEYDALVSGGTVDPTTLYNITDATPIDLSNYWTSAQTESAITQAVSGKADTSAVTESITEAVSGKQDTLIAGDNITISGNVISASGGGGSITIDPSLDSGSTNAVANSAITVALNSKGETLQWDITSTARKNIPLRLKRGNSVLSQQALQLGDYLQYGSPTSSALCITGLTPTSAITSSVTSASTDSEVPSAKAVYDVLPTTTSAVTSGSTAVVESGGVYEQLGGLKLIKLTQSAYDALSPNYDSNTIYFIKD